MNMLANVAEIADAFLIKSVDIYAVLHQKKYYC